MEPKHCRRCDETKPAESFNRNRQSKDGRYTYCKTCRKEAYLKRREDPAFVERCREQTRKWDAANPDRVLAYRRGWEAQNFEKRAEQKRNTFLNNRERAAGYCKAWRARNLEAARAADVRWYAENREKKLAADKARREKHLEAFLERERASYYKFQDSRKARARRWRERNPHRVTLAASLRRAALINRTPGWLTPEDFATMESAYAVAQVFRDPQGRPYHVDHILPLRGRYVSGLHVPSNLQLLPATDNLKKSNLWES